jgi:hypothetical protein
MAVEVPRVSDAPQQSSAGTMPKLQAVAIVAGMVTIAVLMSIAALLVTR